MTAARARVKGEAAARELERAKGVLQRVIEPDKAVAIRADARSMGATTAAQRRIGVFSYASVRPGNRGSRIESTDRADPSLRPPDDSIAINRDDVGR